MSKSVSIAKINDHVVNEDSCYTSGTCIAVSDGAGGCGLFADEWSRYLIDKLPKDLPIKTFAELDEWIDGIWEPFYKEHEAKAKEGDSMLLNKFYDEGSCATMAAAWKKSDTECCWIAYGDSVVFHYNSVTGKLEHSCTTHLTDFSKPPYLISTNVPLEEVGFRGGVFTTDEDSIVFAASDALSHYILMMYELSKCNEYHKELKELRDQSSLNTQLLMTAEKQKIDFKNNVIDTLFSKMESPETFTEYMKELYGSGVVDIDDYTLVVM